MANYKQLSKDERITIEELLKDSMSFRKIAERIGRGRSTVAREVLRNSCARRTGAFGRPFNNCRNRWNCEQYRLCKKEGCRRQSCRGCKYCFRLCPDFERENCLRLSLVPYVCNGCDERHKCTLEKFIYDAAGAHRAYRENLTFSRNGISLPVDELVRLDGIISPLLRKGQSIHAIAENHRDEIMLDEKTIRSYVKAGLFTASVTDLLNTVKMRPRKKKREIKVERACCEGRRYRDFTAFMEENPDTPAVQMDSVIGTVGTGEPVLLTIHFVEAELMLAFRREANTAKSVADVINGLYELLGKDTFRELFPVILCDRGSEFTSPSAMERGPDGEERTKVFYTDPGAPYQKGACENNHSLIRRVVGKGESLKSFTQKDIDLLMNHVNSYIRKKLKNRTPFDVFSLFHKPSVLKKLGIVKIDPDDVTLNPSLLKK
jgi:IS30 family transposase